MKVDQPQHGQRGDCQEGRPPESVSYTHLVGFLGGSLGRAVGHQFRNHRAEDAPAGRPSRLEKVYAFIEKYGTYSIFAGQLWGVTRTFISFPAGAMHMNLPVFIASTALGGAIFSIWVIGWSVIFTGAAGLLFRLLRILTSLSVSYTHLACVSRMNLYCWPRQR